MKDILRYKNVLLSIIIVVVSLFVIKGLWTRHSAVIEDLKKKTADLEKGRLLVEKWNDVSIEYDKLKDSFSVKDEVSFKKFLDEKTKSYGINVTYMSPSSKQEDFYSEMSINLRATTELYETIVDFLRSLEGKKIVMQALRIRNTDEKKRSVDMTVKSFIIK